MSKVIGERCSVGVDVAITSDICSGRRSARGVTRSDSTINHLWTREAYLTLPKTKQPADISHLRKRGLAETLRISPDVAFGRFR